MPRVRLAAGHHNKRADHKAVLSSWKSRPSGAGMGCQLLRKCFIAERVCVKTCPQDVYFRLMGRDVLNCSDETTDSLNSKNDPQKLSAKF